MQALPARTFFTLASACLLLGALPGCTTLLATGASEVAAIAGAAGAATVTNSAVVATGVGFGVEGAADAGIKALQRRVRRRQQDAVATVAGSLGEGEVGRWETTASVPFEGDAAGEVVVSRLFGTERFACKEIVFSVETPSPEFLQRDFYTTTVCRDGERWRWASAEPATSRWGALQ